MPIPQNLWFFESLLITVLVRSKKSPVFSEKVSSLKKIHDIIEDPSFPDVFMFFERICSNGKITFLIINQCLSVISSFG